MRRRRCPSVVFLAVILSFVFSLMLLFLLEVDMSSVPIYGASLPIDEDVHPTLASQGQHRSNVAELLRILLARNMSVNEARRDLDKLRSAVRRLEERVDAVSEDQLKYGSAGVKAKSAETNENVREPGLESKYPGQADNDLASEKFWRTVNVDIDDKVILKLQTAVSKWLAQRKPRPAVNVSSSTAYRIGNRPWQRFYDGISQYELYPSASATDSYLKELLQNLGHLPLRRIEEMSDKGTQLKLIITLEDFTKLLFKPMRLSKNVESNPNHFVFNEMERHHAEIAAFHLDRLLGFHRVPPVAGRYLNLSSEILPLANKHLSKTFYRSPAGNLCFYAKCKYYCDSHHSVCGTPDVIEGSCSAYLPSEDVYKRKTWPNPWAQTYSKKNPVPRWKTESDFCSEVRSEAPFNTGRRLLDLMDIAIFDFFTGNLDRHHYYTFEKFGNFTFPILTDNGRGFGRARKDDVDLLAPVYQCCVIRASTLAKLVEFLVGAPNGRRSLSAAMRSSLTNDVIKGVLNDDHLRALDRRLKVVALVVHDCLNRTSHSPVVIDDGF